MGPRERRGLVAVLVALVLGVVVVEVLGRGDRSVDGVVFGSLFFIAALAYGLASGALAEITGPGGLGVKFSEAAQGKVGDVATVSGTPIEPTDLEIVAKGPLGALEALRERLREGKPIALTLQLGSGGYRGADVITYTRVLMSHDPGLLVVFVDPSGRFVGSTLGVKLLAAMGDGDSGGAQGAALLGAIRNGSIDAVAELISTTRASVAEGQSNAEALAMMLSEDVPALIVVRDGRPVGIVRRDVITARILVAVTAA